MSTGFVIRKFKYLTFDPAYGARGVEGSFLTLLCLSTGTGQSRLIVKGVIYEPLHEISNNVVYVTSKAPDQTAHTHYNHPIQSLCTLTILYKKGDSWGRVFLPKDHSLNKLGRGPLGDATYQISRFYA